jgi:hypothetical protein
MRETAAGKTEAAGLYRTLAAQRSKPPLSPPRRGDRGLIALCTGCYNDG